jgi:hypothetical protein
MEYYTHPENSEVAGVIFGRALTTLDHFAKVHSAEFRNRFGVLGSALSNEPDESAFDHAGAIIRALDILTRYASEADFFGSGESDAVESACQEGLVEMSERMRPAVLTWLRDVAAEGRAGVCYAVSQMNELYQRELLPIVSALVRTPYLVCHLYFIAECVCLIENREGTICVIGSLWETTPTEKFAVALAAVVKADALKLHFGWLGPMLSLRAHADAAGRALLPVMISLVIALGDRGAEALQAIISAFSAIVDAPTNDQSLCRLEAWVAPIFRDPQSERKLHPVFQSLFRTLWPALDGLWESARP